MHVAVIGGCGHVGLPLSIALANNGHHVTIIDVNIDAMNMVRSGQLPFMEDGAEELLKQALMKGTLNVSDSPEDMRDVEAVISIVGTPVDEHLNPTFDVMLEILESYSQYFVDGQTLILRSTVYPGASEKVHSWFALRGREIHVAFCPERIAEGHAMEELFELPQIISSFSERGLDVCRQLFGSLTKDIIETTPMEAEVTKLFNNVWRYIKFAAANQFYMIANNFGLDFYKIHEAMTYKYPRAMDFPKPGFAAGPCLFKDTMQLSAFASNTFFLGHSAMLVNEGLPNYVVARAKERYSLSELKVGILGMAFKAESDDRRESLSYKLRRILQVEAREVLCTDPYVEDTCVLPLTRVLEDSDLIFIATPHKEYRSLDLGDKPVIDVWNILGNGAII